MREHRQLEPAAQRLTQSAMRQLYLSARAFHRVLKLARTSADRAESDRIGPAHAAGAPQYRPRSQS